MDVTIRKMCVDDIPLKIQWINNSLNNRYLHYDLPLEYDKTVQWFNKIKDKKDRVDAVIEYNNIPVGLIGLLNIKDGKCEYYISMGEHNYKNKGISTEASYLILDYAFKKLHVDKVVLYTEVRNIAAQKLFEKVGFVRKGTEIGKTLNRGIPVDRYYYEYDSSCFLKLEHQKYFSETLITKIENIKNNVIFIKRDDLFPFSFGGNKARKGMLFWQDIKRKQADCLVTYGSSSSNHCRVIANIAASEDLPITIVSPNETEKDTFNLRIMEKFGANFIFCPVSDVSDTIDLTMEKLRKNGKRPYFIMGGGHGNIGTQAYVDCYNEIRAYEKKNNLHFDYIFHASGTGTTQAGLVAGQLLAGDNRKIIGISIARKCPRGRDVVIESVKSYLGDRFPEECVQEAVVFEDSYIASGYGTSENGVAETIDYVMKKHGVPLDETYTGKAFWGMQEYIKKQNIKDANILFIHTGGTPLFFDYLSMLD